MLRGRLKSGRKKIEHIPSACGRLAVVPQGESRIEEGVKPQG
jgi:hypothetical protein